MSGSNALTALLGCRCWLTTVGGAPDHASQELETTSNPNFLSRRRRRSDWSREELVTDHGYVYCIIHGGSGHHFGDDAPRLRMLQGCDSRRRGEGRACPFLNYTIVTFRNESSSSMQGDASNIVYAAVSLNMHSVFATGLHICRQGETRKVKHNLCRNAEGTLEPYARFYNNNNTPTYTFAVCNMSTHLWRSLRQATCRATCIAIMFRHMLCYVVVSTGRYHFPEDTRLRFYRRFCWSVGALYTGLWPVEDERGRDIKSTYPGTRWARMAGKPLCGSTKDDCYLFILWKLKGDLEFWGEDYYMPRSNAVEPCACCPVSTREGVNEFPWTDFHMDAPWISRRYTNAQFRAKFPGANMIFSSQPGMGALTLAPDYMHSKHLGFDQYMLGSVLVFLCYYIMPGCPEANLQALWATIDAWYHTEEGKKHASNAYTNITLNMFCSANDPLNSAPLLKGRAAEICALTPALGHAWRQHSDPSDEHHKAIRLLLKLSATLDRILHEHKEVDALPPSEAERFKQSAFNMLLLYSQVNQHSSANGMRLFNITIKCHYLLHIALDARFLNPRQGWCYRGEDMMNKTKILAASCCKARSIFTVFQKMNKKYWFGLHHMYSGGGLLRHRRI